MGKVRGKEDITACSHPQSQTRALNSQANNPPSPHPQNTNTEQNYTHNMYMFMRVPPFFLVRLLLVVLLQLLLALAKHVLPNMRSSTLCVLLVSTHQAAVQGFATSFLPARQGASQQHWRSSSPVRMFFGGSTGVFPRLYDGWFKKTGQIEKDIIAGAKSALRCVERVGNFHVFFFTFPVQSATSNFQFSVYLRVYSPQQYSLPPYLPPSLPPERDQR